MKTLFKTAIAVVGIAIGSGVSASPIPAVTGSYVGNYDLDNAFASHGLWLPGIFSGYVNEWSVSSGTANYNGGILDLNGTVTNITGGAPLSLDFSFRMYENATHPGPVQCGHTGCAAATADMKNNVVFFDMGGTGTQGTITGTAGTVLEGLSIDVVMHAPANMTNGAPKLGQMGFGANWLNLDFGYSNWLNWSVTSQANDASYATSTTSGNGDINLDFLANGSPANPPSVPLPAGLPLLAAGLAGLAFLRKRQA